MNHTFNKTFKELSFPFFKDVYEILDCVFQAFGIECYLIGAQARNFHLIENNIKPIRGTQDIDFAVMIPEISVYEELMNTLVQKGFAKVKEPYRLIYKPTNTVIDLLPFGEVEQKGTVAFTDRETELTVIGMKEVNDFAINVKIEEITIKVSPLEGLIILKLIAYSEKPERQKDLDDIGEILKNYFDINQERYYREHLDTLEDIDSENFMLLAGARLMGRDIKKIIQVSNTLYVRIENTIQKELIEQNGSITRYFLSKNIFSDFEIVKKVFEHILKGIKE